MGFTVEASAVIHLGKSLTGQESPRAKKRFLKIERNGL